MAIWTGDSFSEAIQKYHKYHRYNSPEVGVEESPTTNPDLPYDYSDNSVEEVLEECLSLIKQMAKIKPKLFEANLKGNTDLAEELAYRLNRKYKYYERNITGVKDRVVKIGQLRDQINNAIREIG